MGCFLPHFLGAQFVQYFYFFLRPSRGLEAQLRFNLCATDALSDLRSEATVLPIFFKVSWCLFCPILPAAYFMCLDNTAAHLWLESARRGKADDQSSSSG